METFFLACFAFGLLFLLASLVLGFVGGGMDHGGAHFGHAHAHAPNAHAHAAPHGSNDTTPLLNASSVIGGLTWFGATGYVLTRLGDWAVPAALLGALAVGALGWYLVARFLGLVLKGEVEMDAEDYRMEGTVGRVSVAIPEGGTGEILFDKAGARRSEAARGLGGARVPRGTEVVITRYADGFATVQPWSEFLAERDRRVGNVAPTEAPAHQKEA